MSYYEFLVAKKESGELQQWYQLGLPVHLSQWMEYYAYYLEHPEKSYFQLSLKFEVTKGTIYNAVMFMRQEFSVSSE